MRLFLILLLSGAVELESGTQASAPIGFVLRAARVNAQFVRDEGTLSTVMVAAWRCEIAAALG
jgi:hypothetical protein